MIRPMTSDVSALSSLVANGHQAIHTFPLPPLKFRTVGFPQCGFKRPVRRALHPGTRSFDTAPVEISATRVDSVVGLSPKRHARPLTPHTRPLGSASGCIVHQPHRLLWLAQLRPGRLRPSLRTPNRFGVRRLSLHQRSSHSSPDSHWLLCQPYGLHTG